MARVVAEVSFPFSISEVLAKVCINWLVILSEAVTVVRDLVFSQYRTRLDIVPCNLITRT